MCAHCCKLGKTEIETRKRGNVWLKELIDTGVEIYSQKAIQRKRTRCCKLENQRLKQEKEATYGL